MYKQIHIRAVKRDVVIAPFFCWIEEDFIGDDFISS
jgi:hypothetical protein